MTKDLLIDAHKGMNLLLKELALGLPKPQLEERIIKLTERLFKDKRASILTLDQETHRLYSTSAPNLPDFYNDAIDGIEIGEGVGSCGAAAYLKRSVIVSDVTSHSNWQPFVELATQANIRACWSVPVISTQEHVLGTFALYSSLPSDPHAIELEILESIAAVYSVALEKYALEDKLNYQAKFDSLTQCLNRRALLERVEQSHCFQGNFLGCFFIDIDKFKQVNDVYGHQFGDKVLVAVAQKLRLLLPDQAVLGRYGGDEFLAFSCFPSQEDSRTFYETLQSELNRPVTLEETNIGVSVGFATKECCSDMTIDQLIRLADTEMYKVKRKAKLESLFLSRG
ncbi:sensor domain-containing diguanylate cyclase [Vibrio barjaei]|uniref:diguanylate cyclase n=1 Tax=Vibrio barjaei TaxID=1676683 RepID=A0ABW7IEH3_9VIBR|nr:sensor domain-containing diguanylate cyclase [Vibrio barjaei]MCY9870869.1 sensor domain-containing diguanylate cyclase [Vibrio barjaei]